MKGDTLALKQFSDVTAKHSKIFFIQQNVRRGVNDHLFFEY